MFDCSASALSALNDVASGRWASPARSPGPPQLVRVMRQAGRACTGSRSSSTARSPGRRVRAGAVAGQPNRSRRRSGRRRWKEISVGPTTMRAGRTVRQNPCMTVEPSSALSIHGRVQGVFFRASVRRRRTSGVGAGRRTGRTARSRWYSRRQRDAVDAVAGYCPGPRPPGVGRVEEREERVEGTERVPDPLATRRRVEPGAAQISTAASCPPGDRRRAARPRSTSRG